MSRIEELPETVGLREWILRHPLLQTFVLVSILNYLLDFNSMLYCEEKSKHSKQLASIEVFPIRYEW